MYNVVLIPLWEWFEPRIEMCQKTEAELQEEIRLRPDWMKAHILENPNKMSTNTIILGYDISVYFGEVVRQNYPQIYWGYLSKPKNLHGVNRPRLLGFAGDMSVYTFGRIEVCIWKSVEEHNKMHLYNSYEKIQAMI